MSDATTTSAAPAEKPAQASDSAMTDAESAKAAAAPEAPKESAESATVDSKAEKAAATDAQKAADTAKTDAAAATSDKPAADAETSAAVVASEATGADKVKTPARRKSGGAVGSAKKLNKKASKPKLYHLDAKPGDLFLVKLKGFPEWPVIVADEDMLPEQLTNHRPVTARRPDGTYRDVYADGGKKATDRTYPVMYLSTFEFSWVPNGELKDLAPEDAESHITSKMRKDLVAAFQAAAENKSIEEYKQILKDAEAERLARQEALMTPAKKSKKGKAVEAGDEDVEMADAADADEVVPPKKEKKRKAEEPAETPQRTDSVKKPKIKLTTSSTPKAANGTTSTPKSAKEPSAAKAAKPKTKKPAEGEEKKVEKKAEKPAPVAKEPELTPEEKHAKKEKEVLFLRHKLQKGLLTRDQEPKGEEMKLMSDYITKLEGFPDLEVSIIRATKINKVLKAILKLEKIPKEEQFNFKTRSQTLLEEWNKLLSTDAVPGAPANGVNGGASKEPATNGLKKSASPVKESAPKEAEKKDKAEKADAKAAEGKADKPAEEPAAAAPAVETAA